MSQPIAAGQMAKWRSAVRGRCKAEKLDTVESGSTAILKAKVPIGRNLTRFPTRF